jgi:hypothetical protein
MDGLQQFSFLLVGAGRWTVWPNTYLVRSQEEMTVGMRRERRWAAGVVRVGLDDSTLVVAVVVHGSAFIIGSSWPGDIIGWHEPAQVDL